MRQKRAKTYRKLMALYSMSFGFRQPYQVLIDSKMCQEAIDHKIDIVKQLGLVLQGLVKPMITQCCIHELYLKGKSQQSAVDLAKSFERRKCNHREAIPGDECLESVVGDRNKHRYVIATQSQPLRARLRQIPAVPLVHINRIVMVLEPPSDATISAKEATEQQALQPKASDAAIVLSSTGEPVSDPPRKKRKGPKGPNPLSVKKKKLDPKLDTSVRSNIKGKAKDQGTMDPNSLGNEGQKGQVGEKRKRELDNDGDKIGGDTKPADSTVAEEHSTGRKRKRRRKATVADDTPDGDS